MGGLFLKQYFFAFSIVVLLLSLLCGCGAPGAAPSGDGAPQSGAQEPVSDREETPPAEEQDPIAALLASMTVEEKVGQLFFVRCPEEGAAEDVAQYHLGGVILFGRDFKDKTYAQVRALTDALQRSAAVPLLIGADEEGGTVVRASSNPHLRANKFPAPQALYASGGLAALRGDAAEKSSFLLGLGVNVNFAPVCDISTAPGDYIYPRTLGAPAEETADYVSAVVEEMNRVGIGSVLKHFPGYGNNLNTHTGISLDERPYEHFMESDFLPFKAGIRAGAPAVLVSHNIVACMDEAYPASLSAPVHEILRRELGFEGVILTDDLAMDALKEYTDGGAAAVLALQAGNDMVLTTDYPTQIDAVLAAVEAGEIDEAQIDASVRRVLEWKQSLGLLEPAV